MVKRVFDLLASFVLLVLSFWLIGLLVLLLTMLSDKSGLFKQSRVGQYGNLFTIYKLRTMYSNPGKTLRSICKFLRKSKIDELPQLFNVFKGDMSMVGPRPDIEGYYDTLEGKQRQLLLLKPGLTGPATLKYANEEALLLQQPEPQKYNDEVIFPDKVRINLEYLERRTFLLDLKILLYTLMGKKLNDWN